MLALAGRLVREVGDLIAGASAARKPVATFAIDSEIRFASAADRAAFAEELARRGQRARRASTTTSDAPAAATTGSSSPCTPASPEPPTHEEQ